jgi:hypothetical protein
MRVPLAFDSYLGKPKKRSTVPKRVNVEFVDVPNTYAVLDGEEATVCIEKGILAFLRTISHREE